MNDNIKRLRLASCVKTIIQVHTQLDPTLKSSAMARKIRKLKQALDTVILDDVSEGDLERIEKATNRLLEELGPMFPHEDLDAMDDCGPLH